MICKSQHYGFDLPFRQCPNVSRIEVFPSGLDGRTTRSNITLIFNIVKCIFSQSLLLCENIFSVNISKNTIRSSGMKRPQGCCDSMETFKMCYTAYGKRERSMPGNRYLFILARNLSSCKNTMHVNKISRECYKCEATSSVCAVRL